MEGIRGRSDGRVHFPVWGGDHKQPPGTQHAPDLREEKAMVPEVLYCLERHDDIEKIVPEREGCGVALNVSKIGAIEFGQRGGDSIAVKLYPNRRTRDLGKQCGAVSLARGDIKDVPPRAEVPGEEVPMVMLDRDLPRDVGS